MLPIVSRVVPVIDLKSNQVVHAVAGNRANYRAISSRLVDSAEPGRVAKAFADLGFRNVYVADLDAIGGADPDWDAYQAIASSGLELWVDNGVKTDAVAKGLSELAHRVIIGLEAISSNHTIDDIAAAAGFEKVIVSIDMKSGKLICKVPEWQNMSPQEVVGIVADKGVTELILLDLAFVGTQSGILPSMIDFIRYVKSKFPACRVYSGGGIKTAFDVQSMIEAGCDAVLVSTALHNREITFE